MEMQEDPSARKARLRALREAAEIVGGEGEGGVERREDGNMGEAERSGRDGSGERSSPVGDGNDEKENERGNEPQVSVRFRNYLPRAEELQEQKMKPAPLATLDTPKPAAAAAVVPELVEDPILTIAPRKPNWDLRRDVAKKLHKLEKRTQRAMIELMQQEEERRRQEAEGESDEG